MVRPWRFDVRCADIEPTPLKASADVLHGEFLHDAGLRSRPRPGWCMKTMRGAFDDDQVPLAEKFSATLLGPTSREVG